MPPLPSDRAHLHGIVLVLIAGVIWSCSGLVVRALDAAAGWQIVFYRSLGLAVAMLVAIAVVNRGCVIAAFRAAGMAALIGGLCLAICFSTYVFALLHASVASVAFILSASPLSAAVLGWLVLGERVRPATWIASLSALIGVGIMVAGSLDGGGIIGMMFALVTQAAFAGFSVALRSRPGIDMYPTVCWAGVLALLVSGLAVGIGGGLDLSAWDVSLCLFFGIGQLALGMMFYTLGARVLSAAELTLLSLGEVALNPIWVWLAFDEVPTTSTLAGGSVVLAAIAFQAWHGLRRRLPSIGIS